jgi:hypothetical protein
MVLFCSNTQVAIIVDEDLDQEADALFEQLLWAIVDSGHSHKSLIKGSLLVGY